MYLGWEGNGSMWMTLCSRAKCVRGKREYEAEVGGRGGCLRISWLGEGWKRRVWRGWVYLLPVSRMALLKNAQETGYLHT